MQRYIKGLGEIAEKYQTYLIDMSGVVHNGLNAYPKAINTLNTLKEMQKDIIFFTNAPRPQSIVRKKLVDLGYICGEEKIITSGDLFLQELQRNFRKYNHKNTAYVLGYEYNRDLNLSEFYNLTQDIEQAEVLVILAFLENSDELDKHDEILKKAIGNNIVALCPNPDTVVYHGNELRYPAGFIANKYESLGGVVRYYGKPYAEIYQYAVKDSKYDKSKMLAIGDNLNTDILGAKNFGIDSLLISRGIYKNFINLDLFIKGHKIIPNYICDYFQM